MNSPNGIYGTRGWVYSALMLAARITLAHFSVSLAMSLPKSAGEPGSTVAPNPDYAPHAAFLGCPALTLLHAHAVDRSGLDRCESTRCATRVGLICRDRRRFGAQRPAA